MGISCRSPSLELVELWLSAPCSARTQQGSQPRRGQALPPCSTPQADLEGEDLFNERVPEDKAGASCGVAQEVLQREDVHGRMRAPLALAQPSVLLSRGCAPRRWL